MTDAKQAATARQLAQDELAAILARIVTPDLHERAPAPRWAREHAEVIVRKLETAGFHISKNGA